MIAVLTSPRLNGFMYARASVPAVVAQAAGRYVALVVDGHWQGEPIAGAELVELGTVGHARAYFAMMRLARARNEHLLALEDDIELAGDAIPYMDDFEVPRDLGAVQFCSSIVRTGSYTGMFRVQGQMRGFQAVKWPYRSLALFAGTEPHHSDPCVVFTKWARETHARIGQHIPDLVRHVGEISIYEPNSRQRFEHTQGTNWVGEGFSAGRDLAMFHLEGRFR